MRRTRAPSQLAKNPCTPKGFASVTGATRSTEKLLNLVASTETLVTSSDDSSSHSVPLEDTVPEVQNIDDTDSKADKKVFNVVWGKQTKKKHKTWEGDGTVEVSNDTAVLKDENGQILGRTSKLKAPLEEGSRVYIGSKEVEIIDEVCKENINVSKSIESVSSSDGFKRPVKRFKTSCSSLHVVDDVNALVLPKPDLSHQWKYNKDGLPITDVKLDSFLSRVLRPHQQQGVVFLYSCVTGIRDIKRNGAILADEMGLGKTLQCICLIWLLLKNGPYGGLPLVQRVLIVTPSSLANNWLKEFKRWLGFQRLQPYVISQKQKPSSYANIPSTKSPVMIISYEMLVRHFDDIKDIKFQLLICDEGHRLKNNQIRTSTLLNQLNIRRRIILTGTPIQNDLQEFHALVDFVNPGILGSYAEFKKHYEDPVVLSNQPGCDDELKQLGEDRAKQLNLSTNCFILRRTQSIINQYLPSKQECVVFCIPTPLQVELSRAVVQFWESSLTDVSKKIPHLSVITLLKKICNDPRLVKGAVEDVVEDDFDILEDNEPVEETLSDLLESVFSKNGSTPSYEFSGKMSVLEQLLVDLRKTKEKIVLISYFTQTLNLLEKLCVDKNYPFLRLDGSTPASARMEVVDKFNNEHLNNFVFLLSAKAGGIGLNLTGASRLILFDLDWNPASDLQAMSRIWRDGQKKNCFIYRFLTSGTIEEKIYQRQISKTALSNAIVDIHNTSNVKLSIEELKDLFVCDPDCSSLTHDLLSCHCDGTGIPDIAHDDETIVERECQLNLNESSGSKGSSKISELLEWEHYAPPFDDDILQELYLKSTAERISFLFRNKCSTVETTN
ncbi:DNA repair and recombination protein RAD54B-like [Planococcus citri]|uniref:DNA repair and recombination protein RAD54B-like n=1 Tax=Planococcus citri TaxID=170843 RepID=UPI0031F93A1B